LGLAGIRLTVQVSWISWRFFEKDPQTEAVLILGEIGGRQEDDAAEYFKKNMSKPLAAFIAGQTAPPGRRMGHAGAIIEGASGTAAEKMKSLERVGIRVATSPESLGETVAGILSKKPQTSKSSG